MDANAVTSSSSASGDQVAFDTDADNISAEDNHGFTNVFVRDLIANTTTLVSRAPGAAGAGANDDSVIPAISGDGNRVAFQSGANNLSNEDNNAVVNVFVRDIDAASNALVSRATGPGGAPGSDNSANADISPSGRY